MKCQSLFSGKKNMKKYFKMPSAEFFTLIAKYEAVPIMRVHTRTVKLMSVLVWVFVVHLCEILFFTSAHFCS